MNFIVYNVKGEILRVGSCPREAFNLQAHENEFVVAGSADMLTQYISDGSILDRPSMSIEINGSVVSGVPIGASISIDDKHVGVCDSGIICINKEHPDDYNLKIEMFPYVYFEAVI